MHAPTGARAAHLPYMAGGERLPYMAGGEMLVPFVIKFYRASDQLRRYYLERSTRRDDGDVDADFQAPSGSILGAFSAHSRRILGAFSVISV